MVAGRGRVGELGDTDSVGAKGAGDTEDDGCPAEDHAALQMHDEHEDGNNNTSGSGSAEQGGRRGGSTG